MLWRSRRAPAYRERLAERCGRFEPDPGAGGRQGIWVHAVSVGETLAAAPLIEALLADYPGYRVVVTTTTPTGSERVRALFGDRVFHVYCPWDLPTAVARFLRRTRPGLLLLMETELWPNLLHGARAAGCRTLLANARLSARSARRYARFPALTRSVLGDLDRVACQSAADGERLLALGLPGERLRVTGSIKFDLELDPSLRQSAAELRALFGSDRRPVLAVASTHPGEDEQVLKAFARIRADYPDCLLLLAPRHPERFDAVAALCQADGWRVLRRSAGDPPGAATDVLLADTMGELLLLLGTATVAVIGGSLVQRGGHNPLEAAAWGVPVVTGPSVFNFAGISGLLQEAGAMIRLERPEQLADCLLQLLGDENRRRRMGQAGIAVVDSNRGARRELLEMVGELLAQAPRDA